MEEYGIGKAGFHIKPFQAIIEAKMKRAQEMFGSDVDLRSSSVLRKILDISSYEDHELWKSMEQYYYSNFLSTATGDALDLLGEDMGLKRRFLWSTGKVTLTMANPEPGRLYHLPVGTLVETGAPVRRFRTGGLVSLSEEVTEAEVGIVALERGPQSNMAAGKIKQLNEFYSQHYLNLGTAQVKVTNDEPVSGGEEREEDSEYRGLLLGYPRTLWTLEAVHQVVKNTAGVRDCRLFDPAGGTDVSKSIFNFFKFNQRRFGSQRSLTTPYYFDILVAIYPGFLWQSGGGITGIKEAVEKAVAQVRPISIFPNVKPANHVRIGLRAKVFIRSGHDRDAILTSIKERLYQRINTLGLGRNVLYSEVMYDCMNVAGVVDVQQLQLRCCPARFGQAVFGRFLGFKDGDVEFMVGENIELNPAEIAVFEIDSKLIDIEVSDR